jgi:hypothetical protein
MCYCAFAHGGLNFPLEQRLEFEAFGGLEQPASWLFLAWRRLWGYSPFFIPV